MPYLHNPILRTITPFLKMLLISLIFLSLFRAWYIFLYWDRVNATDGIFFILLQGLRFDLITISGLIIIPATLSPFISLFGKTLNLWGNILRSYLWFSVLFLLFMELATTNFIEQYDARPNILFVEYLSYPKEVFSMLFSAYKFTLIFSFTMLVFVGFLLWETFKEPKPITLKLKQAAPLSIFVFLILSIFIRSSFDHRPANPSIVAFSTDLMANDLALNSSYSLTYALYETRRDQEGGFTYGKMDTSEMLTIVKDNMHIKSEDFIAGEIPTLHKNISSFPSEKPLNIIIILEESLGAEFVGSLGGLPLTPNIDALGKEGWWFENLYATGTRSVRGIEAIVTGFTPTPAKAVVKLNKSQRNFFTFAKVLKEQGYSTSFIYGGEAHFDNMLRFFMNNGFQSVVDENDYVNPIFTGSWGVSDEDLFNKAHEQFSQAQDKPFFSLVFSSSNHVPFEFPDGRIGLYDHEKATVNNAVKYADYALGNFFKNAKASSYWDDTIFLVVADHNSRVFGANLVPIERFHIPGFILGKNVKSKIYSPLTSQIDLLPTVLSLAGVNSITPAIGRDLTKDLGPDFQGRAMMQYNNTQAYMEDNQVVVLEKDKKPKLFTFQDNRLEKSSVVNEKLNKTALAHSLFGSYLYANNLYTLPNNDSTKK